MALFVDSPDQAGEPGVFPVEIATPTIIEGIPQGYVGIVFQTEWGPVKVAYKPTSAGDLINTYFPVGSAHTSSGYYSVMRRRGLPLVAVRVLGGDEGLHPPDPPTITNLGTAQAKTVKYSIVAKNAAGDTIGSAIAITETSHATLDGTNKNKLDWDAVTGATSYDVYRTFVDSGVTPATTGKLGNTASTTYTDDGDAGDSAALPSTNTTGWKEAICFLLDADGVAVATLIAKWPGTHGNGFSATVAAASDADSDHFNLTVSITDPVTGTASETFPNVSTIDDLPPDLGTSILLSDFNLIGTPSTRPANGSYTFAGGSNGSSIASSDYEDGLDELALQDDVRIVVADDCGNSIRAAVNAALQAHAEDKTDRIALLHGDDDNTHAENKTDVASYRSDRVIYFGKMVNVKDDSGTEVLAPFATFAAGALANLEPHQSHAWRDPRVTKYYSGVSSIPSTNFSTGDATVRRESTTQGICLPIRLADGRFAALHDRVTLQTVNKRYAVTRRIKDYLALSLQAGLDPFVNGPNIAEQQKDAALAVKNLLDREAAKGRLTEVGAVDVRTPNNATTAALGEFYLGISAKTPAPQEKIFPLINVGPTVVVTFA